MWLSSHATLCGYHLCNDCPTHGHLPSHRWANPTHGHPHRWATPTDGPPPQMGHTGHPQMGHILDGPPSKIYTWPIAENIRQCSSHGPLVLLYCTVLYGTVQYCTVQYCTVQFSLTTHYLHTVVCHEMQLRLTKN